MNMKALFKLLYLGVSLGFLISCTPETVEPMEYSAPFIANSPLTINVDGEVSLTDGSRGVRDRLWTFPGGGVVTVNGQSATTSTDQIVHATFLQSGSYSVRLQTNFNDPSVSLDTTIVVTVWDYVNAQFTSSAPIVNGSPVVEVGQEVTYSNNSSGNPNTFLWTLQGATPSTEMGADVTVKYEYPGTYDVTLIAYRTNPFSRDTIQLREYIRVIPSTTPSPLTD
jgi:FOG: PKD repeat